MKRIEVKELISEIPMINNCEEISKIDKGWSSDEKYYLETIFDDDVIRVNNTNFKIPLKDIFNENKSVRKCSKKMGEKKDENTIKETADKRLYTYGDYINWNDEQRYELVDGQVYMMTPAPYRQHQKVLTELFRQIANYLVGKECEVYAT